jgi:hypothetical protein
MIRIFTAGIFILFVASGVVAGDIHVDGQMWHIFSVIQENISDKQTEAVIQLVRRADELNGYPKPHFGLERKRKGNKNLLKLLDRYQSSFSPTSLMIIKDYLRTGRLPELTTTATVNAMKLSEEDKKEILMPAKGIEICAGGLALDSSSNSLNKMLANGAGLVRKIKQIEEQKRPDTSDSLEFKNRIVQSKLDILQRAIDIMVAEGTLTPEVENALRSTAEKIKDGN